MSASSITQPVTVSAPTFTGTSKFASSLQQVLNRSIGIAALPLQSLSAGLTKLGARQSALQTLDANFSSLQQSVVSLQNTVDSGLLSSTVSDGTTIRATVQPGTLAGDYSIEVTSLGSFSTALSNAGSSPVTSPSTEGITGAPSVTLSVGGVITTITPVSSSLQDLASAINTQASGQVQATLVNVGSTSAPDYRLSLRAAKLGTPAIGLTDSLGADLISSSTAGSLATYKINGLATDISSDSRTVTISPGLTVNLLAQSVSGQPTTISVHDDPSALLSAFSQFAQAYNSAFDAIAQQHGVSGGALQGDSILQSLTGVLQRLGNFTNGTPSSALANFGLALDRTGHLSVDSATFTSSANANFPTLLSSLGSSTTGGFLKTASEFLNGVEDATTGTLKGEETSVTTQTTAQQARIDNETATITQLQANLTAQIAKADAAIALLESRVSYTTGLFATFTGASNTQSNGLGTL